MNEFIVISQSKRWWVFFESFQNSSISKFLFLVNFMMSDKVLEYRYFFSFALPSGWISRSSFLQQPFIRCYAHRSYPLNVYWPKSRSNGQICDHSVWLSCGHHPTTKPTKTCCSSSDLHGPNTPSKGLSLFILFTYQFMFVSRINLK